MMEGEDNSVEMTNNQKSKEGEAPVNMMEGEDNSVRTTNNRPEICLSDSDSSDDQAEYEKDQERLNRYNLRQQYRFVKKKKSK